MVARRAPSRPRARFRQPCPAARRRAPPCRRLSRRSLLVLPRWAPRRPPTAADDRYRARACRAWLARLARRRSWHALPFPPRTACADSLAGGASTGGVAAAGPPTAVVGSSAPPRFGARFFSGVADWGVDAVAAKLVAYVAGNYPRDARDAFKAAARDGAARNYIVGAAVVRCKGAEVARVAADLVGPKWCSCSGTMVLVQRFFEDAKVFASDDGGGAVGGKGGIRRC